MLVYSNGQIAVADMQKHVYATVDAPPTLDAMIDFAVDRYGIAVPAARFLQTGFADLVTRQGKGLTYVGLSKVGATDCHLLTFDLGRMSWQLWIEAGEKPLPRRVIALGGGNGRHYVGTFDRWELEPAITPDAFQFVAPAGAEKIDIVPLHPDVAAE